MDVTPEVMVAIGAAAGVLPLYAVLDRVCHRLRVLEQRLTDATAASPPAAEAAAQWRTELAALEADGRSDSPKSEALRRRLQVIGESDGLRGAQN
jgi:hypothetical protein